MGRLITQQRRLRRQKAHDCKTYCVIQLLAWNGISKTESGLRYCRDIGAEGCSWVSADLLGASKLLARDEAQRPNPTSRMELWAKASLHLDSTALLQLPFFLAHTAFLNCVVLPGAQS